MLEKYMNVDFAAIAFNDKLCRAMVGDDYFSRNYMISIKLQMK